MTLRSTVLDQTFTESKHHSRSSKRRFRYSSVLERSRDLRCQRSIADLLNKRQKQSHVVDHIGDIFLDMVPHFAPFVKYGAHQLYGKYEFEKEKGSNPAFAKFVEVSYLSISHAFCHDNN